MKLFFLLVLTIASSSTYSAEVKYYFGKMNYFFFPNDVYEKSIDSLVKRTVDRKQQKIEEVVTQPAENSNEKPSEMVTLITKITDDVFQAEDITNATFTGTITFIKKFDQWNYNLRIGTGTLTGSGGISKEKSIVTNKILKLPQYKYERTIREELKLISKKEYLKKRKEILEL